MGPKDDTGRIEKAAYRYADYEAYHAKGGKIGHVDDLFVDRVDRREYIELNMGLLGLKPTLVPVELCEVDDERMVVLIPFSKTKLRRAPRKRGPLLGDEVMAITPDYEDRIRAHFGLEGLQPPAAERSFTVFSLAYPSGQDARGPAATEQSPAVEEPAIAERQAVRRAIEEPVAAQKPATAEPAVAEEAAVAELGGVAETEDEARRVGEKPRVFARRRTSGEANDETRTERITPAETPPEAEAAQEAVEATLDQGRIGAQQAETFGTETTDQDRGQVHSAEETAQEAAGPAHEPSRIPDDGAAIQEESTVELTEGSSRGSVEQPQGQTRQDDDRQTTQEVQEQGQGQRNRPAAQNDLQGRQEEGRAQGQGQRRALLQPMARGAANAYAGLFNSALFPFLLYQQGLAMATQIALGGLQTATRFAGQGLRASSPGRPYDLRDPQSANQVAGGTSGGTSRPTPAGDGDAAGSANQEEGTAAVSRTAESEANLAGQVDTVDAEEEATGEEVADRAQEEVGAATPPSGTAELVLPPPPEAPPIIDELPPPPKVPIEAPPPEPGEPREG